MANDFYGRNKQFTPFSRARGDDIAAELDAIEAAFDKLPTPEQIESGQPGFVAFSGTNSLTASLTTAWAAYTGKDGYLIAGRVANTNTGTVTLDVDGLGSQSVVRNDGQALAAGDLQKGGTYQLVYNETASKFYVANYVQSQLADAKASALEAQHWAQYPEDEPVPEGDGTEYSSAHHRAKAEDAQSAAEDAAADASNTWDAIRGRYYGTLASDPSTDPLGNPVEKGDRYFNSTGNVEKVYNGSQWVVNEVSGHVAEADPHPQYLLKSQFLTDAQWLGTPIGHWITLPMHMTGAVEPPTDDSRFRYIKLTAGEDGVGGYNEGILINETSSGSGDEQEITAEINLPGTPFHGQTIHLWNSEERYPAPGETSGVIANDQMQQITGELGLAAFSGTGGAAAGAFDTTPQITGVWASGPGGQFRDVTLDSANSPGARTGTKTNVKREDRIYYFRGY